MKSIFWSGILSFLNLAMTKRVIRNRFALRVLGRLPRGLQMFVLQVIDEPIAVVIEKGGIAFTLETSWQDDHFASALCNGLQDWEDAPLRNWMDLCSQAPRNSLIIDVGAYSGIYSILAAKLSSGASVLAFEPNPFSFQRLMRNVGLNEFAASTVKMFDVALGSEALELPLSTPQGRSQSSGAKLVELGQSPRLGWEEAEVVSVRPLSDFISQSSRSTCIYAMKIDAEGYELEVLKGAATLLAEHKPTIQIELLDQESFSAVSEFLSEIGYGQGVNIDGNLRGQTNYQFAHYGQAS